MLSSFFHFAGFSSHIWYVRNIYMYFNITILDIRHTYSTGVQLLVLAFWFLTYSDVCMVLVDYYSICKCNGKFTWPCPIECISHFLHKLFCKIWSPLSLQNDSKWWVEKTEFCSFSHLYSWLQSDGQIKVTSYFVEEYLFITYSNDADNCKDPSCH